MSELDPRHSKRLERAGYNLIGGRYRQAAAARLALTEALLAQSGLQPGQRILDLASGPGLLAEAAAERVGGQGLVVATDIAEGQLSVCPESPCIRVVAADAEALPFADGVFERVLCGLGLMFFPDAARALREARRVLGAKGRIALSVWGTAAQVPLVECALACLRRLLPPQKVSRPSVFRYGDPALLHPLLAAGGFERIEIVPLRFESRFPDAAAYWQGFLDLAGGVAGSLARLSPATQAALAAGVALELAPYRASDGYLLHSEAWIASAVAG